MTRYIVIIGNDEKPGFVTKEIDKGVLTVLITAQTWNEAELLRREGECEQKS